MVREYAPVDRLSLGERKRGRGRVYSGKWQLLGSNPSPIDQGDRRNQQEAREEISRSSVGRVHRKHRRDGHAEMANASDARLPCPIPHQPSQSLLYPPNLLQ